MNKKMFSNTYYIWNETLNAVTHGLGTGLSITGLILLLIKASQLASIKHLFAYLIYGVSLIILFLSSTLFHSLIFTKAKKVFQVFDHSSIYLLIAGSYTPFCLLALPKKAGFLMLLLVWGIALLGILYKSIFFNKKTKADVLLYIIMGWLCLFTLKPLWIGLGSTGFWLLVAGGVTYTLGAIFYSLKQVPFMHVVWHLFVLGGATFMFFSILFYT
ncbi:PAQR family membrane homeostasis protein TrhA [Vagococcus humatus]|uniref:Hemolysin III n=1 Tax=Vagococcus humatus TaxID=1889241 RepID=A0A3R9YXJ7_9ENTE|nr:hemolysin III family protein [Vagococcus humatus]RST89746.1 hemolysin III [Vagococcus humatus]